MSTHRFCVPEPFVPPPPLFFLFLFLIVFIFLFSDTPINTIRSSHDECKHDYSYECQYQCLPSLCVVFARQVDIPFESFVAVKRNYVDFGAPRVNEGPAGGKMLSLGIILSRFSFNEVPGTLCLYSAGKNHTLLDVGSVYW